MVHLFSSLTAKKRRRSRSDSADFGISPVATEKDGGSKPRKDDDVDDQVVAKPKNQGDPQLPVHAYRREILQAILQNKSAQPKVLLITAATGSGKSTQIPAYFLHTDHVMVVTQPRRVAAVTLAHRVVWDQAGRSNSTPAVQSAPKVGQQIGYRVRFDDCTCSNTQLVYATDGMLLREAMMDPLWSRYSIIFLDEAHERSLQTDVLMGVVQTARLLRTNHRRPLQVVVMSATL
jgi:HrpA-like RNA helicase